MKSEKLDKLDALAETLKGYKINNAGYYASDSANKNDAIGNPESNPKTVTGYEILVLLLERSKNSSF